MWQWWRAWRQERAWRAAERRHQDFCPACRHPWSGHHDPDGCEDCDYEIAHGYEDAPAVPCSWRPLANDDSHGEGSTGQGPSSLRLAELLSEEQRRVLSDDVGVLMTVGQAAAGRAVGTVLSSDLPDLAVRWLTVGLDTPALRELAGHPRYDGYGIDALWQQVLAEVPDPPVEAGGAAAEAMAWVRVVPVELARWRRGEVSSQEAAERLLALQETVRIGLVAGMAELFVVEEMRWESSTQPLDSDRERDAILAAMAADVIA